MSTNPGANCADFGELLSALADGELSASERERAEAHAASCAGCRATLERFRRLDAAMGATSKPPAVAAGRWELMLADVKRAGRVRQAAVIRRAPVGLGRRLGFFGAAAAAAAALLVAALLLPGRASAGPEYTSAESVAVEPSLQVMIWDAPDGGLRLVSVAMAPDEDLSGEKAGG